MKFFRALLALLSGRAALEAELARVRRAASIHADLASAMSGKADRLEARWRDALGKLDALRAEHGLPPPAMSDWTPDELTELRRFQKTPVGAKYCAQLRDMTARHWAASAACPAGQEPRRLGYCHGFADASAVLIHLCALLDREPAEPSDADAPSGDAAPSQP